MEKNVHLKHRSKFCEDIFGLIRPFHRALGQRDSTHNSTADEGSFILTNL